MSTNTVNCPNCGHLFDVTHFLSKAIEEKLKQKYIQEKIELENQLKERENNILQAEKEIQTKIQNQVEEAKKVQEEVIRNDYKNKMQEYLTDQKLKLEKLELENKELKQKDLVIEDLKRKNETQRLEIEVQFQKRMNDELQEERKKLESLMKERYELMNRDEKEKQLLRDKEYEEKNRQLTEQMQALQRKIDQGSMQAQGEAQELVIQESLKKMYPTDRIEEVEKGIRGADCIHTVINKQGKTCGKILYESKRTKNWTEDWIEKLKKDNAAIKADILVIITETMPTGTERLILKDNVWVCSYLDYKPAIALIRHHLLLLHEATEQNSNVGDKKHMLYEYFKSIEFKTQFQAILGGYEKLQHTYSQEKKLMHRIWSQREKEMDHILINAHEFLGSLQGIAGGSFVDIALPDTDGLLPLGD